MAGTAAVTGHEGFERAYRVQMNTLELMVAFLPALFIAAKYWPQAWVAVAARCIWSGGFSIGAATSPRRAAVGPGSCCRCSDPGPGHWRSGGRAARRCLKARFACGHALPRRWRRWVSRWCSKRNCWIFDPERGGRSVVSRPGEVRQPVHTVGSEAVHHAPGSQAVILDPTHYRPKKKPTWR